MLCLFSMYPLARDFYISHSLQFAHFVCVLSGLSVSLVRGIRLAFARLAFHLFFDVLISFVSFAKLSV